MPQRKPRMDAKQREVPKLEAVRRLAVGESDPAIATEFGMVPDTVHELGKKAREHGSESLRSVPRSGRSVKLARTLAAAAPDGPPRPAGLRARPISGRCR